MVRSFILLVFLAVPGLVQAGSVLVVGDSISAGYGLEKVEQGWVGLLRERLRPRGIAVVNASISGETSAGGLARIDELLAREHPTIVILELGGNDGLRGLSPKQMEANLAEMIARSRKTGAKVMLLGMKMPPNYGKRFTQMFEGVYATLAHSLEVTLVPFLLEGVGGHAQLMQADGIHPTREAQALLLDQVWLKLQALLEK